MKKINQRTNLPLSLRSRTSLKKGGFKSGFTLFELLVSISIIAIMTALASVAFSGAQKKARDSRRMQDIKAIQTAAEQYYSQNGYSYPLNRDEYVAGKTWTTPNGVVLESYPSDPKYNSDNPYECGGSGCSTSGYCVCATMENPTAGNSNDSCSFGTATSNFCIKNQQ